MANLKLNHVWVIDTADASIETEHVCIHTVRWVGTAGGAGTATITDLDPKHSPAAPVIWEAAIGAAGGVNIESDLKDLILQFGFGVPTLLAGTKLYIYLAHVTLW